ncbi:hypothetical protein POJ06DRAFT_975 [Lipomyces tetrasporus]|uniref:Uncharacterized protein n=1 Tax=Lipomyces tetrasporus TaxID=54092 RepID=A0AAD7VVV3_9ASCO|nr:uncharacterized protein POJ06DRAFT_975 [Lipomyces tetrasporus]KAJ8103436.1 hypothetical protein POJ06DRAFT_975 [Lipomyces tetrasporus]
MYGVRNYQLTIPALLVLVVISIHHAYAVVGNYNNLTNSQALYAMLECIESCDGRYNYTLSSNYELIVQPYEIRELNYSRGSTDVQLSYCTDVVGSRFWVITSSNLEYEEDLQDSQLLDTTAYEHLSSNMPTTRQCSHW